MAIIDILKRYDALRASGMPDEQAKEAIVLSDTLSEIINTMATKSDIRVLISEIKYLKEDLAERIKSSKERLVDDIERSKESLKAIMQK
jgi:hypothetical protein